MDPNTFGWRGKILRVELGRSAISEMETMHYAKNFLGGRGIASRIYWDEVPPSISAYDPENRLIFMTGPLGATGAQGASRFAVVGKSPMLIPEGFCYGNLGGYFGPALKNAGYDGIVISGCADRHSYISIHDGKVAILDATPLWGKGTYEVRDMLVREYGKKVHFVTTGPAGENLCRSATLMTDQEGSATGGFGAVMGSKRLKAIAVIGTGTPDVARPKDLKELNRFTINLSARGTLRMPLPRDQIRYVGKASCYQCGLDCLRGLFRTAAGNEVVRKCQSLVFYMPWVSKRAGEPLVTAIDATRTCNDLSLCTMEMANLMRWLDECYRSGFLTEKGTGLAFTSIGSREFLEELAQMTAHRKGFGDILAEGLLRARGELGSTGPEPFMENLSGVGIEDAYSPRLYITHSLLYPFEPRQHMGLLHEVSYMIARWLLHRIRPELSPTTDEVFRAAATRFWGHPEAWDMRSYQGKAVAAVRIQDRTYVKDSLILCDSAWPIMDSFNSPDHVGDPTLESRLFTAATGVKMDEPGLRLYGERIFNLQRAILLREGRKPKTSDVASEVNFTVPLQTDQLNPKLLVPGPSEDPVCLKGNILERSKFEEIREEFYELRGWDPQKGLQKTDTLVRLGLSDIVQELEKIDLVAAP